MLNIWLYVFLELFYFQFSDDEEETKPEPVKKKFTPSERGSDLFSLLPQPKLITSGKESKRPLVPHILTKKPDVKKISKKKSKSEKTKNILSHYGNVESDDEFDEEDNETDFFSLSKAEEILPATDISLPHITSNPPATQVLPIKNYNEPKAANKPHDMPLYNNTSAHNPSYNRNIPLAHDNYNETIPVTQENYYDTTYTNNEYHPINTSTSAQDNNSIDQQALLRLTGKQKKGEIINLIDVKADDALLGKHEWMTKALAEEKPMYSYSNKKGDMPTQQQKRKHQITYLARQAQERELELKNQWANNRMAKKETQSKYGF